MAVIVGSARQDENGHLTGGIAGDQTGKEVCTENWYRHRQGWRVLRAKDPDVAEKIAWDMQAACDNPHIGYDQSQNQTLFNIVRNLGYNCAEVTTNCETDCSQLVRICVMYAGVYVPFFSTADEASILLATGAFEELTDSKYTTSSNYLKRGDILVTRTKGHTVVVLSDGSDASSTKDVIAVDGDWGKNTTMWTQKLLGTIVDGIVSRQPRSNKKYLPNAVVYSAKLGGGWEFKTFYWQYKNGSDMVRALQKYVGAEADGWFGPKSVKALQSFLKAKGLYDGDIDGYLGPNSVIGWQKYVNSQFK